MKQCGSRWDPTDSGPATTDNATDTDWRYPELSACAPLADAADIPRRTRRSEARASGDSSGRSSPSCKRRRAGSRARTHRTCEAVVRIATRDERSERSGALSSRIGVEAPRQPMLSVRRNLSTSLRHSPKRNYCRSPLPSAGFGGLIQTAVGGSAGRGARRTNRSGCAA